jgi:hypothetical protein
MRQRYDLVLSTFLFYFFGKVSTWFESNKNLRYKLKNKNKCGITELRHPESIIY